MRKEITKLFNELGEIYKNKGIAELELIQGHDVHAFYRLLDNPDKIIHVQGYVGMSNDKETRIWARLMDYNKMIDIRKSNFVSPGNEHDAVIEAFPNFQFGVMMPYNSEVLEGKIKENL